MVDLLLGEATMLGTITTAAVSTLSLTAVFGVVPTSRSGAIRSVPGQPTEGSTRNDHIQG